MPEYNIRVNGVWRNVCSEEVFFRHQVSGEWKKFKSGDSIRLNNNWVQVNCNPITPCSQGISVNGGFYYPSPYEVDIDLGSSIGLVDIECMPYTQPDKFEIWWNGSLQESSGYIGSHVAHWKNLIFNATGETMSGYPYHILRFNKTLSSPNKATLKVYGPLGDTVWNVNTYCPNNTLSRIPFSIENKLGVFVNTRIQGISYPFTVNVEMPVGENNNTLANRTLLAKSYTFTITPSSGSGNWQLWVFRNGKIYNIYSSRPLGQSFVYTLNMIDEGGYRFEYRLV